MGKLIDKLERLQRTEGPRLGFGTSTATREPCMALVALLPDMDAELAAAAVEGGADCLLVRKASGQDNLAKALGVSESVPCGAEASGSEGADGAGWDFAVLGATDPVGSLLAADRLDRALRLDADAPESVLRTLESLPLEAILLPAPADNVTLETLMPYYRVSRSTSKPVLAGLASGAEGVLGALRDAGVVGVVVSVDSVAKAKGLAATKKALEALPPKRSKRRGTQTTASLGLTIASTASNSSDDDDDDDD